MTSELFNANLATTTVSSGGTTAPSAGTSQSWTVASSTGFPVASNSATPPTQFHVADPAAPSEMMAVTNVAGTTWTVTRGVEGTTPVTHTAGFTVYQVVTTGYLTSVNSAVNRVTDWVNVVSRGADPTGGTAIDTIVNSLISGLPSQGGVIYFPTGTYKVGSGLSGTLASTQTVTLTGDGASATLLDYYGSTDTIRLYNATVFGSGGGTSFFSGVRNLTIDGTHAIGGSAAGLHLGDITFPQVKDIIIQNFTGATSKGLHLDNTTTWTEEGDYRLCVTNCTQGVVLDVTTGFNSYGYSDFDVTFFQGGSQSCFCVVNGAFLYHSSLFIRGDVNGSASAVTNNAAVIYVSGPGPAASQAPGGNPGIQACHVDVLIEPNNQSGSAPNLIQTIYLDNAVSFGFMVECYGIMDFGVGTGAFAPISTLQLADHDNNFTTFSGIISGDSNLNPSNTLGWQQFGSGSVINYLPSTTIFDGFFPTLTADTFYTVLDGSNNNVFLNYGGIGNGQTLAAPQRKLLFIQQPASGGPYPLVWPGTTSSTNTNPTIWWPGGAPPVLQMVPNGVDVIELVTYNGATWYGRQLDSYGTAASQVMALAPRPQRMTLTSPFTSTTGTLPQNVTGMNAYLQAGTYRTHGWFPCTGAGVIASTQVFGWTFSGTTSTAQVKWSSVTSENVATFTSTVSSTALAGSTTALAMTSAGIFTEFDAYAVVTTPGMMQLTVRSGVTGDEVTIPAGAFLDVEPLA